MYELISSSENLNPLHNRLIREPTDVDQGKPYMHARPPPMNVILNEKNSIKSTFDNGSKFYSQVRVNPWNLGIYYTSWKRREPSFRFPLRGILSPDFGISVRVQDRYDYLRIFWHEDLMYILPIVPFDGAREGEDYIVACPAKTL